MAAFNPDVTGAQLKADLQYRVLCRDFSIPHMELIAKGGFGKVFKIERKTTGAIYALKEIPLDMSGRPTWQVNHEREKIALKTFNSPYIIKLWNSYKSDIHIYFLMEYAERGDLMDCLAQSPYPLEIPCVRFFAAEIIMGLQYIRSLNFVHRDIKMKNILVDGNCHIKLTDFGTAKQIGQSQGASLAASIVDKNSRSGTRIFMAPEVWYKQDVTFGTDYWNLAFIIFKLYSRRTLVVLKKSDEFEYFCTFDRGHWEYPFSDPDQEINDLVFRLTRLHPLDRLGTRNIQEIKDHPFFSRVGVDWDNLSSSRSPGFVPRPVNYGNNVKGSTIPLLNLPLPGASQAQAAAPVTAAPGPQPRTPTSRRATAQGSPRGSPIPTQVAAAAVSPGQRSSRSSPVTTPVASARSPVQRSPRSSPVTTPVASARSPGQRSPRPSLSPAPVTSATSLAQRSPRSPSISKPVTSSLGPAQHAPISTQVRAVPGRSRLMEPRTLFPVGEDSQTPSLRQSSSTRARSPSPAVPNSGRRSPSPARGPDRVNESGYATPAPFATRSPSRGATGGTPASTQAVNESGYTTPQSLGQIGGFTGLFSQLCQEAVREINQQRTAGAQSGNQASQVTQGAVAQVTQPAEIGAYSGNLASQLTQSALGQHQERASVGAFSGNLASQLTQNALGEVRQRDAIGAFAGNLLSQATNDALDPMRQRASIEPTADTLASGIAGSAVGIGAYANSLSNRVFGEGMADGVAESRQRDTDNRARARVEPYAGNLVSRATQDALHDVAIDTYAESLAERVEFFALVDVANSLGDLWRTLRSPPPENEAPRPGIPVIYYDDDGEEQYTTST